MKWPILVLALLVGAGISPVFAEETTPEYSTPPNREQGFFRNIAGPIVGKKEDWKLDGYYKNLFWVSKTVDTHKGYVADLQRLRLGVGRTFNEQLRAKVVLDQDMLLHNFRGSRDLRAIIHNDQHNLAFVDADKAYVNSGNLYAEFVLYRAYLKYDAAPLQMTVGKQMIDWGRMRFYSPMDLFNPISPFAIDRDERPGVDAVDIDFSPRDDIHLDTVYAAGRTFSDSSVGSRLLYRWHDYDLFLMGGDFQNAKVVGGGFDGYLRNAGFRGEFTQTHGESGRDFFRGAVGLEYSFFTKLSVLGEYFYNGGADDSDPVALIDSYRFFTQTLTLKKHLVGLAAEYEIHPLVKAANYVLYDAEGSSFFINPEIRYNMRANLDLKGGAQFYCGGGNTEFSGNQNIYYVQLQFFY